MIEHVHGRSQNLVDGLLSRLENGFLVGAAGVSSWRDRSGTLQKRLEPISIEPEWWEDAGAVRETHNTLWTFGDCSVRVYDPATGFYVDVALTDVRFEASSLYNAALIPKPASEQTVARDPAAVGAKVTKAIGNATQSHPQFSPAIDQRRRDAALDVALGLVRVPTPAATAPDVIHVSIHEPAHAGDSMPPTPPNPTVESMERGGEEMTLAQTRTEAALAELSATVATLGLRTPRPRANPVSPREIKAWHQGLTKAQKTLGVTALWDLAKKHHPGRHLPRKMVAHYGKDRGTGHRSKEQSSPKFLGN